MYITPGIGDRVAFVGRHPADDTEMYEFDGIRTVVDRRTLTSFGEPYVLVGMPMGGYFDDEVIPLRMLEE